MTTHGNDSRPEIQVGDWIAWTDHNGEEQIDEVLTVGTKRITTALTHVAFNVPDLRIVPKPGTPSPVPTPTAPAVDLRAYHLQGGEWIQWTDERDQEHTDEVRGWDDELITTARTRVPWTARNLRLVRRDPAPVPEAMDQSITTLDAPAERRAVIPLDLIDESPFNPRKTFDAEKLAALAASIREGGLIDPLLVRPKAGGRYELVDGARRRRACPDAGLSLVPVRIREMDDDEASRIMFETQEHREPLNPIDRAEALLELVAKHGSQRKVAKHLECDQSAISRATAIARLPAAVKALGRANTLSPSHLERLVKWNDFPAICTAIAEQVVQNHTSVAELAKQVVPFADVLRQLKLVKEFYVNQVAFDRALLEAPEYSRLMVKPANGWGAWYCLEPRVFKRLTQEARDAEKEQAAAAHAKALQAAGAEKAEDLPKLETIRQPWVERTDRSSQTPSCDGKCDCAVQAFCGRRKQVVSICTNPAKLRALQAVDIKTAAARRQAEAQDLIDQLYADLRERSEISSRDLVYMSGRHFTAERFLQACELLGLEPPPGLAEGNSAALAVVPAVEARNVYVLAAAFYEADQYAKGWHPGNMLRLQSYLGIEPAPEPPAHE